MIPSSEEIHWLWRDAHQQRDPEPLHILVLCEHCGSEGRLYYDCTRRWDFEPRERSEICPVCDGAGEEAVEAYPIEMKDLSPPVASLPPEGIPPGP